MVIFFLDQFHYDLDMRLLKILELHLNILHTFLSLLIIVFQEKLC
jgi:hypothetical protein